MKYYCIKSYKVYDESKMYIFTFEFGRIFYTYKCISFNEVCNLSIIELNTFFIPYRIKVVNDILY